MNNTQEKKYITGGIVKKSTETVFSQKDILLTSKRQLALSFVKAALGVNGDLSFEDAERLFKETYKEEDYEEDFWAGIAKTYMLLEHDPPLKAAELIAEVTEDLHKVSQNIMYLSSELEKINNSTPKTEESFSKKNCYKNKIIYFAEKNKKAKDEIVDFMTYKLRSHVLKKSRTTTPYSKFIKLMSSYTSIYSFKGNRLFPQYDPFDISSSDIYSNKFLDLPISIYKDLLSELRKNPSSFTEYAEKYIKGEWGSAISTKEKIKSYIKKSHLLDLRKETIGIMISHFTNGDYISFASMAPLQIEGIFSDICHEIKTQNNQIKLPSLNDKIRHINDNTFFPHYEYYAFEFPVLRNHVAHGGLKDGNLKDAALRLMLDLLSVCRFSTSDSIPINKALKYLNAASEGYPEIIMEWITISDQINIPDFYKIDSLSDQVVNHINNDKFWEHIKNETKKYSGNDIKNSEEFKIARIIKKRNIAPHQTKEFFSSISAHIKKDRL